MFSHAIILAAGKGLRMRPLTIKTPKALALFNGKTLVESVIKKIKKKSRKYSYYGWLQRNPSSISCYFKWRSDSVQYE